jgi:hypothetical protein
MKQHGRRSQAALELVAEAHGVLPTGDKPQPPPHATDREVAEWWAVIDRLGPAWFPRETHGLLAAFCSVKCQLDDVNQGLAKFSHGLPSGEKRWKRYQELTRMRGALSTQLASLATKMRLTPQSRNDRDRATSESRRRQEQTDGKPWDD